MPVYGDPRFVDPAGSDYHPGSHSAARDAGVPAVVTYDIDGDMRFGLPDIGADEYLTRIYLPLVMR